MFGPIRKKFAITFSKIRDAINEKNPPLEKLKRFIADGYPHLSPEISHANSIDEILDVVKDHCTLINTSCLEAIVERFDIKEAEAYIQTYKEAVQSFCKKTKASLCLNEDFKVTKTPTLLRCETAVYVLNWDPKGYTVADVREVLAESVEENVEIRYIREGQSIVVTCFFPFYLATVLSAKAQETLELMKEKGLVKLTVGYCTIYDKDQRDEVIKESTIRQQLLYAL